ncbi:acyl carrier protein [Antarctobacter jejuensis]|uniref:acyl carrier protein n=1 Tax=Antarctobacter jejuensis TaxID=1439938 RepID=UPI003FD3EBF5
MTQTSSRRDAIRSYIEEQFLVTYGEDFEGDTNLFQAGIMDSFGYVQLVGFLTDEFGVTFDDDAIFGDVMVSLDRMVAAVNDSASPLAQAG